MQLRIEYALVEWLRKYLKYYSFKKNKTLHPNGFIQLIENLQ